METRSGLAIHRWGRTYMGIAGQCERFSMKWDGEWHITVEVFPDLGLAFAAVLVLIYVMVVGWFRSFVTPLVIMAPIPLTLGRHLPGPRADGGILHGDLNDRLHRGRRNCRA